MAVHNQVRPLSWLKIKQFSKERPADDYRMPAPIFKGGYNKGRSGFAESPRQDADRISSDGWMVYQTQNHGFQVGLDEGPQSSLQRGGLPERIVRIEDNFRTATVRRSPDLLRMMTQHHCRSFDPRARQAQENSFKESPSAI